MCKGTPYPRSKGEYLVTGLFQKISALTRTWKRRGWILIFTLPTALVIFAVLIYPLCFLVNTSLQTYNVIRPERSFYVGLENYREVLADRSFWHSMGLTALFIGGGLFIQVTVGTLVGVSVSGAFRGGGIVRGILLAPMMVAPVVVAYVAKMMFNPTWGLVNYILGFVGLGDIDWLGSSSTALFTMILIDSWKWIPFVVLTVTAGVMGLPESAFEAARVDGATSFQTFRYLTIPMLRPIILTAAILRAMGLMKVFDIVYVTTGGGPGDATEVINLLIHTRAFSFFQIGPASAMSLVLMAIFAVLCVLYVRFTGVLEG